MDNITTLTIGPNWEIIIPKEIRPDWYKPGARVSIEVVGDTLVLRKA